MKGTIGLAAVAATMLMVAGCNGLHGRNRGVGRDPVQLPGVPSLDGSAPGSTIPSATGSSMGTGAARSVPIVPPTQSVGSN